MFYRITVDLSFEDEDAPRDILDKAMDYFSEAKTINPGQDDSEQGVVILQKCYHDEDPTRPCVVLEEHHTPP